jgi:hypothetical protein
MNSRRVQQVIFDRLMPSSMRISDGKRISKIELKSTTFLLRRAFGFLLIWLRRMLLSTGFLFRTCDELT